MVEEFPDIPGCCIDGLIAEGGMAVVYSAVQQALDRRVAVKVMKAGDDNNTQRFLQEARYLATLNHRHVVTIYDVGTLADGRRYLTMEILPGGDLRNRLKQGLDTRQIRTWILELADALQVVHQQGMVHRDIKPANILFRADGSLVLSDFGIAKNPHVDVELTQAGSVVGSPAYSSPEQVSARPVDARSDQYSLGIVLLEMLFGYNPYRAEEYAATLVNQLQMSVPTMPSNLKSWQPVLDRLLAKDPDQRFVDMVALKRAVPPEEGCQVLSAAVGRQDDPTLISTRSVEPTKHRVRPWSIVWLLGVVVLVGIIGLWGVYRYRIYEDLQLAQQRFRTGWYMDPAAGSALDYYHRVLARDAHNSQALAGLAALKQMFVRKVSIAEIHHDWVQAATNLRQARRVSPEDPALVTMQTMLQQEQARYEEAHRHAKGEPARDSGHHAKAHHGSSWNRFMHNLFGK
ncbi:MAG: serine/threonine protein kinase [Pseudomonadales bacterium]|nr:serine/threonine protein kinase [Pseudomonadales bacterium]